MSNKHNKTQKDADKALEVKTDKAAELAEALGLDAPELPGVAPVIENELTEPTALEAPSKPTELTEPVEGDARPEVTAPVLKGDVPVTDENGTTMFIQKAPTHTADGRKIGTELPKRNQRVRLPSFSTDDPNVNLANSSNLTFPTDRSGVTKDIKEAMKFAASRIAGDESKYQLTLQVIELCVQHIKAKYKQDAAQRIAQGR